MFTIDTINEILVFADKIGWKKFKVTLGSRQWEEANLITFSGAPPNSKFFAKSPSVLFDILFIKSKKKDYIGIEPI